MGAAGLAQGHQAPMLRRASDHSRAGPKEPLQLIERLKPGQARTIVILVVTQEQLQTPCDPGSQVWPSRPSTRGAGGKRDARPTPSQVDQSEVGPTSVLLTCLLVFTGTQL